MIKLWIKGEYVRVYSIAETQVYLNMTLTDLAREMQCLDILAVMQDKILYIAALDILRIQQHLREKDRGMSQSD